MAELKPLEVYAYTEEALGLYTNDNQEEFEILYTISYSKYAETNEVFLHQISRSGHPIPRSDGIWKEVRKLLRERR